MNPIAKKLQIKPGSRVALFGAPRDVVATLQPLPEGAKVSTRAVKDADVVVHFVKARAELDDIAASLRDATPPVLWFAYPKKSSGVATDLTRDEGWKPLFDRGFVGVASISISDTWSGLRMRPGTDEEREKVRNLIRAAKERSATKGKTAAPRREIAIPDDLARAAHANAAAKATLAGLAPSHLREYVTWIESAKKAETRAARIAKAVEMLASGIRDRNAKYR